MLTSLLPRLVHLVTSAAEIARPALQNGNYKTRKKKQRKINSMDISHLAKYERVYKLTKCTKIVTS